MKWMLVGHRGVGKSHLLERLKVYFKALNSLDTGPVLTDLITDLIFIDLDHEIESLYQKTISILFSEVGEAQFREIEQQVFQKIHDQNKNYILSVGAGFTFFDSNKKNLQNTFQDIHVIWITRETDKLGRIFFNRPRLNSLVSALEEFNERFALRQKKYAEMADEIYWMPEGIESPHPVEEKFFTKKNIAAKGILTLTPWHVKSSTWPCLRYACDYYEIRDDLLALEDYNWQNIPQEQRWLSFRSKASFQKSVKLLPMMAQSDWALELGACPLKEISVISSHEFLANETLTQFLLRLEAAANEQQHLKAAPEIKNYSELQELFSWQEVDPEKRSILPRSTGAGRKWLWARLYQKGRQKINFWRDGEGSAQDQPTLFEWLSTPNSPTSFAALLGNPVTHSKTMIEHADFFAQKSWPIWPVLLEETEFKTACEFLNKKGLRAAAVTAPLKKQAAALAQIKTPEAEALQAVNTLVFTESPSDSLKSTPLRQSFLQEIHGHNTDLQGLQKLIGKAAELLGLAAQQMTVVIWGGGGTLAALLKVVPQAIQLSVRTAKTRHPGEKIPDQVDLLIWAAGPRDVFPPDIKFDLLVDLNYREDSNARELALQKNKKYLSGDLMFKAQAAGQREFWTRFF